MLKKWLKLLNKRISFSKDNFGVFLKEEEREVQELLSGKESWLKYRHDSLILFKDYFIPHNGNDNRPKILRPRQLTVIALILILFKVSVVGYLFSVYQLEAQMSETTVNQVFALTNESRVANDVNRLNLNEALNRAAQIKAEDMLAQNYFSHTSPDGRKPWDFVDRGDYAYTLIGENLAMNFITATDAHEALMASPSHQKNILNDKYTDIGLAVVSGQLDGHDANILVEMFGAKVATVVVPDKKTEEKTATSSTTVTNIPPASTPATSQPVIVKPEEESPLIGAKPETRQVEEKINISEIKTLEAATSTLEISTTSTVTENKDNVLEIDSASSTEPELISEPLPEEPILATTSQNYHLNKAAKIAQTSKIIYSIFLILLIIALLINIFIRVTVQHKKVILQAVLLIILVTALLLYDFDFMQELKSAATAILVL